MNKARMLLAVGAVGVVVAGGSAFTASVDFAPTDHVVGYGSQTITGANATDVAYTLSSDGTTIDSVSVTLDKDVSATSGQTVKADFDGGTPVACTPGAFTTTTTVVCTFTGVDTNTAGAFNMQVN